VLSPYDRGKRRHGAPFCRVRAGKVQIPRAGRIAFHTGGDEGAAASRRGYTRRRAWVLLRLGAPVGQGISTRSVDDQVKAVAMIDERCKPPDPSLPTRPAFTIFFSAMRRCSENEKDRSSLGPWRADANEHPSGLLLHQLRLR
jgi:hypothetical protein